MINERECQRSMLMYPTTHPSPTSDMTELLPPPSPMLLTYDGDVTTERRQKYPCGLSGADASKFEARTESNLVMRRIPTATAPSCWPSRTSRTLRSLRTRNKNNMYEVTVVVTDSYGRQLRYAGREGGGN